MGPQRKDESPEHAKQRPRCCSQLLRLLQVSPESEDWVYLAICRTWEPRGTELNWSPDAASSIMPLQLFQCPAVWDSLQRAFPVTVDLSDQDATPRSARELKLPIPEDTGQPL